MLFLIVLSTVTFTYGFNCPPCDCFNDLLFCQGIGVQVFPTLSTDIKVQLKRIEIVDTAISCMPSILDNEYVNLKNFIEEKNLIFNCSCMTSWFINLPQETIIRSMCSDNNETTPTTPYIISTPSFTPSLSPHPTIDNNETTPTTSIPNINNTPSFTHSLSSHPTMSSINPISLSSAAAYVNSTTGVSNPSPMETQGVILLGTLLLVFLLCVLLIGYCVKTERRYCICSLNRQRKLEEDMFELSLSEDEVIFNQSSSTV